MDRYTIYYFVLKLSMQLIELVRKNCPITSFMRLTYIPYIISLNLFINVIAFPMNFTSKFQNVLIYKHITVTDKYNARKL